MHDDLYSQCTDLLSTHVTTVFARNLGALGVSRITPACLTCVLFDVFKTGSCSSDERMQTRLRENPLLHYAALFWGPHESLSQDIFRRQPLPLLLPSERSDHSLRDTFETSASEYELDRANMSDIR